MTAGKSSTGTATVSLPSRSTPRADAELSPEGRADLGPAAGRPRSQPSRLRTKSLPLHKRSPRCPSVVAGTSAPSGGHRAPVNRGDHGIRPWGATDLATVRRNTRSGDAANATADENHVMAAQRRITRALARAFVRPRAAGRDRTGGLAGVARRRG